jgi:chromosome segregation ATPase
VSVISAEEALAERDRALSDAYTQIEALRYSLSALTALSADLSNTLEERNRSYESLLGRAAGVPEKAQIAAPVSELEPAPVSVEPADVLAAQLVERETALHDLRTELDSATAATGELESLLQTRNAELLAVQEQISALQAELAGTTAAKDELELHLQQREAELGDLSGQLTALQANLDALAADKMSVEAELASRTLVLDELDYRLAAVQSDLLPFLPGEEPVEASPEEVVGEAPAAEVTSEAPAAEVTSEAPVEESAEGEAVEEVVEVTPPSEPVNERLARATAISSGVAAALAALKAKSDEVAEANAQLLSLEDQVNGLAADKTSMALTVEEKDVALAETQAQIDSLQAHVDELTAQMDALQQQVTGLQTDLESTQAAKVQVEEELQLRSAELDEINAQIDGLQAELQPLLGAEVLPEGAEQLPEGAELLPQDAELLPEGTETPQAAEGEEPGDRRLVRMGALTAGVAGATHAIKKRDEDLAAANDAIVALQGQVDSLTSDKTGLEASLQEKEQLLAETQEQVVQLQASVDNLTAQVDMLNQQMSGVQAELQSTQEAKAQLEAQLAQATADLESALAAKADLEAELQARNAELDDLNAQIDGFQELLQPFMEGEEAPEVAGEQPEGRRLVRMGALTAGVAGAVRAVRKRDDELLAANADLAALQDQLNVLNADKASLETSVQEKEQALVDTQNQIAALQASVDELAPQVDGLNAQIGSLQADLESAHAAKAQMEVALEQRTAELGELNLQLEGIQAELAPLMAPVEEEGGGEGAVAGEETRGPQLVRMGAITAGVAAAASAVRDKERLLEEADVRAAALEAELQSRDVELAETKTRLAETNALFDAAPAVAETTKWFTRLSGPKRAAANAAIREGVLPYKTPRPQKLAEIMGIGKVFEQRLYDTGIGTFWEVSQIEDDQVQSVLDITDWQMMRLDLNEVRSDALRLAHETTTVGAIWEKLDVDDFEVLEGVGKTYERRLYEAGLATYADIANATVEQLAEICHAPKMRTPDYASWIAQAQRLVERGSTEQAAE